MATKGYDKLGNPKNESVRYSSKKFFWYLESPLYWLVRQVLRIRQEKQWIKRNPKRAKLLGLTK